MLFAQVFDVYNALMVTCAHPQLKSFKFPHKSILNTFSAHTLERRRGGFNEFFKLLLLVIRDGDMEPVAPLSTLLSVPAPSLAQLSKRKVPPPTAVRRPHPHDAVRCRRGRSRAGTPPCPL